MAREPYDRRFFEQPVDVVARELIGTYVRVRAGDHVVQARVVESEAYGGLDDPASHAFRGPTPRSAIMFGPAGYLYVYKSYGLHWCMNVVTQGEGTASAVLLRSARMIDLDVDTADGVDDVRSRLIRGPGNLTRALGITGADNGADCCVVGGRVEFWGRSDGTSPYQVVSSARVGISRERERPWRYFLVEN